QRPRSRRRLCRGDPDHRCATRRRGDRPPCGGGRGQHGRTDWHPGRRARRSADGERTGIGRRGAALREGGQRPYPGLHAGQHRRLRFARGSRRRSRRVSAAPRQAAQSRGPEEESAPARRTLALALGSGHDDRAGARPAAAHRELRTGCHGPDDPGPVDSRKAVRRGQFRRCPGLPGQGAQRGVRRVELSNAGRTAAGDDNDAFTDVVVDFVRRLS
ncbi:LOW QUALITY PROTEIN: peroxidase bpoB, partial [Mycobacterium tuberculosis T92]